MLKQFIKKFDLYGKYPEFYFKGKSNKTTWIGRIFTFLYIIILIAFFIYKLERMIKRKDVTFYDINTNKGKIPSIKLNRDIFYTGFALDYPGTDIPFIDDRIYTISAKYISRERINGQWNNTEKEIKFKKCELSDFGQKYQNILSNKNLSQMLCPISIDFILEGYYTMERHSFIRLNYKRCVNTTENKNNCYPNDIIEKYLSMANIDSKIQDIELTPEDHDNPIQHLERNIRSNF